MSVVENIFLYLRNLTFIAFLYAGVLLYPGLINDKVGIVCLILLIIYCIITFFMIFVRNSNEEGNIFNNIVMCILHLYFCFICFRYVNSVGFELVNDNFFTFNYFIASLSMFVLSFNKFLLLLNK